MKRIKNPIYDKWILYTKYLRNGEYITEPRLCYIVEEGIELIEVQIERVGLQYTTRDSIMDTRDEVQDYIDVHFRNNRRW